MTDEKRVSEMTQSELVAVIAAGVRAGIAAVLTFGTATDADIRKAAAAELERRATNTTADRPE